MTAKAPKAALDETAILREEIRGRLRAQELRLDACLELLRMLLRLVSKLGPPEVS